MQHKNGNETTDYYYSGGTAVAETKTVNGVNPKTTLFYRGSDMGGGVGGINYAEYSDGSDFNYKFYNLRGDVIMTLNPNNTVKSSSRYYAFGTHDELVGNITTDKHRANTKVEDSDGLLNEGYRFRSLDHGVFLTPDPLEYVDGLNMYVYVGQNPWGRFDPHGLSYDVDETMSEAAQAYAHNVINNIRNSTYGQDKSSAFHQIDNNSDIKIKVVGTNGEFFDSQNRNRYNPESKTIYISEDDAASNNGYVLDNGKGGAMLGNTSAESMFVHETQHALDDSQGKSLTKTHDSEYGKDIPETETNAVTEANKYRESKGERKRLYYNSTEYRGEYPGKLDNPSVLDDIAVKLKRYDIQKSNAEMPAKLADRQRRMDEAKAKKDEK